MNHDFICYGEILWDILPGGAKPGGAPMNVAYHLKMLGHHPAIITRIGDDERGAELIELLNKKHIPVGLIQKDEKVPTGIVHATPNEQHEMTYEIVAPAAWDYITWNNSMDELFTTDNYLVFGSLICRNDTSKTTLFRLLEGAKNKVLDINLRPPHYDRPLIEELMSHASIVKMNREELALVSSWTGAHTDVNDQIVHVQDRFNIPRIVVTIGGEGAKMSIEGNITSHPGYHVVVEDTVGSGDAFLAALLSGIKNDRNPEACLAFACAIGALVTSKKGAWPEYNPSETSKLKQKQS